MSPVADESVSIPDDLNIAEFAAEFLRRAPDYRQDFYALPDSEKCSDRAAALAQRWGLRFPG
ncbi:transcriptional regulator domain-containing protein [Sphingobium sp. B2]|uniref:transcriptional regulator domain-containing protein n=1 Tax=Sphingobium sp. B2 TaxID=2583228 RepID=UPI00119ECAC5